MELKLKHSSLWESPGCSLALAQRRATRLRVQTCRAKHEVGRHSCSAVGRAVSCCLPWQPPHSLRALIISLSLFLGRPPRRGAAFPLTQRHCGVWLSHVCLEASFHYYLHPYVYRTFSSFFPVSVYILKNTN